MNLQSMVDFLQKEIQEGRLDPSLEVTVFDGVNAFVQVDEESIQKIGYPADPSRNLMEDGNVLCLNSGMLPGESEEASSDLPIEEANKIIMEAMDYFALIISKLQPIATSVGEDPLRHQITSVTGLYVFADLKAKSLKLLDKFRNIFIELCNIPVYDAIRLVEEQRNQMIAEQKIKEAEEGAITNRTQEEKERPRTVEEAQKERLVEEQKEAEVQA